MTGCIRLKSVIGRPVGLSRKRTFIATWRQRLRAQPCPRDPNEHIPKADGLVNNLTFGIVTQLPDLAIAISLVAPTGRVSVLPLYARIMLPPTVVSRPIDGAPPMINLALEYSEVQGRYIQDRRAR